MEGFRILLTRLAVMQIYWNKRKFLHKKKAYLSGLVWNTTTAAVRRIVLGHQYGRRFIVLGHQYGRRDVM